MLAIASWDIFWIALICVASLLCAFTLGMARGENEWKGYPIDTGKLETGRYYDVLAVVPALVEGEHVALIRGWDAGPILSYQVPGAIAVGSYVIGRDEEIVKFWPCGAIRPAAEPT